MGWLFVLWLWLRTDQPAASPDAPTPASNSQSDPLALEIMKLAFAEQTRALDFSLSLIASLKRSAQGVLALSVTLTGLAIAGQRASNTAPQWWYNWALFAFASTAVICMLLVMPVWPQRAALFPDTITRQAVQQSGRLEMVYACLAGIRRRDGIEPNKALYNRMRRVLIVAVLTLIAGVVLWAIPTVTSQPPAPEVLDLQQLPTSPP